MESFPSTQPEDKKESIGKKVGKAVLAGSVLLSTAASEAQPPIEHTEEYQPNIATRETSNLEKDTAKIIHNLIKLEDSIKKLTSKTSKGHEMAYAVITETNALGNANYLPNNIENAVKEDIEVEIVNREGRNYKVMSRDRGSINTLLKERHVMEQYGAGNAAKRTFETFVPVDKYIVVGVSREQSTDSVLIGTIRIIDLHTKKATLYTFPYELKRRDVDDGYENLSQLMQVKIKDILKNA